MKFLKLLLVLLASAIWRATGIRPAGRALVRALGTDDEQAGAMLEQLYREIPAPIYRTDPDTACMVKYACNAFHALKVVFAN